MQINMKKRSKRRNYSRKDTIQFLYSLSVLSVDTALPGVAVQSVVLDQCPNSPIMGTVFGRAMTTF